MRRPTADELQQSVGKTMPDVIAPGLRVLFCGINPSVYSAVVGHHFARPGNRFWKALHASGFTPRLFSPDEDAKLLEFGLGVTNIAPHATVAAADLPPEDYVAGGASLREKVLQFAPKYLAVLGVSAYRVAFGQPKAAVGEQPEVIGSTRLWVLPNPSGLNAHYQLDALARLYRELRLRVEE